VQYEGAATNAKSWLYANQQGSVVALANATGATTASQGYGPFGETEGIPGSRFGYTGQQHLAALGLYYYKARMYSPGLGRFLQTDPVGYQDDLNWYVYVGNNPVNFTDPTGLGSVKTGGLSSAQAFAYTPGTVGAGSQVAMGPLLPLLGLGLIANEIANSDVPMIGGAIGKGVATAGEAAAAPILKQVSPKNLIPIQTRAEMTGSQIKRLEKDMRANGFDQTKPVDVVRRPDGRLEIQDGHHRVEAAKGAKIDQIPVQIWEGK
jgi:RHS repeat-associated protein